MSRQSYRVEPFVAVLTAAGVGFAGELCVSLARGNPPSPGYYLVCFGLTLASALVLGGFALTARTPVSATLAAWVAVNGAWDLAPWAVKGVWIGAGFGLTAWVLLSVVRRSAVAAGAVTAASLLVVTIVWPRALATAGLWPWGVGRDLLFLLGIGLVLASFAFYAGFRGAFPRLPSETVIVIVAVLGLIAIASTRGDGTKRSERPVSGSTAAAGPTIVVLVLDTVAAEHLSIYGYERDTTPSLRRFLETNDRAVLYPFAFSPANWTLPAHASLFTGEIPSIHRAHSKTRFTPAPLRAERTLAEALGERGYRSAAIFSNPVLSTWPVVARGFDLFLEPAPPRPLFLIGEGLRARFLPWAQAHAVKRYASAATINRETMRFLEGCGEAPCFVVANYMEAHTPYAPDPPYAGTYSSGLPGPPPLDANLRQDDAMRRHATGRYDEEILALDAALGELLARLSERGILDRAWLIVTSDHGESFGGHDMFGHASAVYNEQVRIPLIVRPPAGEEIRPVPHAVSLLDLTATIAAIAGTRPLGIGRDLRAAPAAGPVPIEFFGRSPAWGQRDLAGPLAETPARAVVLERAKLIEYPDRRELYDLDEDPFEKGSGAGGQADVLEKLTALLPPLRYDPEGGEERRTLTPEEEERLRALGYIQ